MLVVDGQLDMLGRYATALDRAGFRVRICRSSAEAVRLTAEDPPDQIVVGPERPGGDGWQLPQQVAAESATATVPILAATAIGPGSSPPTYRFRGSCSRRSSTASWPGSCPSWFPDRPAPG